MKELKINLLAGLLIAGQGLLIAEDETKITVPEHLAKASRAQDSVRDRYRPEYQSEMCPEISEQEEQLLEKQAGIGYQAANEYCQKVEESWTASVMGTTNHTMSKICKKRERVLNNIKRESLYDLSRAIRAIKPDVPEISMSDDSLPEKQAGPGKDAADRYCQEVAKNWSMAAPGTKAFYAAKMCAKRQKLLDDINIKDMWGQTPLILAIKLNNNNSFSRATALINSGADVNLVYDEGRTALMYAANYFCYDRGMIEELLSAGADVDIQTKKGENVFTIMDQRIECLHGMKQRIASKSKHQEQGSK